MSDHSILSAKLAALTARDAVFVGQARVISDAGQPAALAAILAEIDATVLERLLVFDIDGVILRLAVSARRLRGLLDVNGACDALTGNVLSTEDPAMLQATGTLLTDLCNNAQRITVKTEAAVPFGNPAELGVSASVLTALWHKGQVLTPRSSLQGFLAAQDDLLSDYLCIIDGRIVDSQGDITALNLIWRDQLTPFRTAQKSAFPRRTGPILICLDAALGNGRAAGVAMTGDEIGIFSCSAPNISRLLAEWHRFTG